MNKLYTKCLEKMKEVTALAQVSGLVGWDQETMMPPKGINARAAHSSAIAGVVHEKATSPQVGEILTELSLVDTLTEDENICVKLWRKDYEKAVKIPPELVRELAKTEALAHNAWIKARKDSDFKSFAPWLEKIFALKSRQAEAVGFKGEPYNALLDDYEPELTVQGLNPIVEEVKKGLIPLVSAIKGSAVKIDKSVLKKRYPESVQESLVKEVMKAMGVDTEASRLDRSIHPFCCGIATGDVRITTRYNERYLPQALYGVIHESGHAMYDQGLPSDAFGTPLSESVSLGIHESQSRLWENVIGRSRPFVKYLLPLLKKRFASQMKGINADSYYYAINEVKPSFIRVEADEVTYNLHVVIRYEIERALLAKELKVIDLPGIWNEKMKKYFGIVPKNDAEGVLQDTHWSDGMIGYFPTYMLGNLFAAQLWVKICRDIKGVERKIEKGDFAAILLWLRRNIHQHGRRFTSSELIERSTGAKPDAKFFIEYLRKKYGEIYGRL